MSSVPAPKTGGEHPAKAPLRLRAQLSARRLRLGPLVLIGVVAALLGGVIGRATAPDTGPGAGQAVETEVLPVALDADGIWTSTTDDQVAVSEALIALRRDGDPRLVESYLQDWLVAYDAALMRLAAADVPNSARPVQRQFITAVTLSRDAVEVLGHAAAVDDTLLRRDLTTEVGRLRSRAEQLTASARASIRDLDGARTDVGPLPGLRGFEDGRAP
ncbi:MAG: hypothetical protein R6V28_12035 [Nitriliruptoraceae bacterium]